MSYYYSEKYLFNKFVKTTILDSLFFFILNLYLSFFSPYLSTLGFSETQKGIFFALFPIVSVFIAPIIGTVSDKIGRYKIMIIGFFLEIIVLTSYIFVKTFAYILIVRILSAIAFSSITITAISRINDTVKKSSQRSKVNGIFQTFISLAALVSPLIGGFIADYYNYTMIFRIALFLIILTLLSLFLYDTIFYEFKEQPKKKSLKIQLKHFNPFRNIAQTFKYKELKKLMILGAIVNVATPFKVLVIPYILIEKMHLTNAQLSIAIFVIYFAHTFQFLASPIIKKIGEKKSIILSLIVNILGIGGFFLAPNYALIILFLFIRGLGESLFNIAMWSYMSEIAEKKNMEGQLVGSYKALSNLTVTCSFLISGYLLNHLGKNIILIYLFFIITPVLLYKLFFKKINLSFQEKNIN